MRRREKITILAVLLLLVIFLFQKVLTYDTNIAHPYLTENIIELYESQFGDKINDADEQQILLGSMDEDTPIRWMNHFYEPNQNIGLLGFQTAKDWAQDGSSQSAYARGDQSWQTALDAFAGGNNQKAFKALGHVLHLIEDMTVPAHTRLDIHVFNGGDPYESWAKSNQPSITVNNIYYTKYLDSYFLSLANFSNKNFFSADTININSNSDVYYKILNDGKYAKCIEGGVDGVKFCIARVSAERFDNVNVLDEFVHSDYFSLLAPKAVSYGAGVIQLFFEQAEKLKLEKTNRINNLFQELLKYYQKYFGENLVSSAYAYDYSSYPRLLIQSFPSVVMASSPQSAEKATITPIPVIIPTTKSSSSSIQKIPINTETVILPPPFIPESPLNDEEKKLLAVLGIPVGATTNGPKSPENEIAEEPEDPIEEEIEPPALPPEPVQWATPEYDELFLSPVFTSSTRINIYGSCAADTQSVFSHFALAEEEIPQYVISTTTVSGTVWSVEVPLLPGDNFFFFSAIGPATSTTSTMSSSTQIIFDNTAPSLPLITAGATTTTGTSTLIRIDYSSEEESSLPILYDLGYATSGTDWLDIFSFSTSTGYDFFTTSSGEYFFRARASDSLGNYSDWSTTSVTVAGASIEYNYLSGAQEEPEVILTKKGSPYILQIYSVPAGKSLRIQPGVVIKGFDKKSRIEVKGSLIVEGTAEEHVVFTSVQDRNFSDEKFNAPSLGKVQSPGSWDWVGVWFNSGGTGMINFADFRYSGSDPYLCAAALATCGYFSRTIYLDTASATINNSTFGYGGNVVIVSEDSSLSISNSILDGLLNYPSEYAQISGIYIKRGALNLDSVYLHNLNTGILSDNRSYLWPAITTENFSADNFINVAIPISPAGLLAI